MRALSPSSIKLFAQCPRQWKARYIDEVGTGPPGKSAERGTRIHEEIEQFLRLPLEERTPFCSNPLKYWNEFFSNLTHLEPEVPIAVDERWQQVDFDDDKAMFRGIIDGFSPGKFTTIFDWKTGRVYAEDHAFQASCYVALSPPALMHTATMTYLDSPLMTLSWDYSPGERLSVIDSLKEKIHLVQVEEAFNPTPGNHCRWCPVIDCDVRKED